MEQSFSTIKIDQNWQFRQVGSDNWYPARVPGCNFTDLMDNGLIDDPFYADNETKFQWIEKEDWEYKTWIDVSAAQLSASRIYLMFEGLDTYCDIFLNGRLLEKTDNMFVAYKVACDEYLVEGKNALHLVFHSPIKQTRPLYEKNGFTYPAENDKSDDRLSVYSRKAPYHFGWDWGPRFVTSGIWRNVSLQFVEKAQFQDIHVCIESLTDDSATVAFDIQLTNESRADRVEVRCTNDVSIEPVLVNINANNGAHIHRVVVEIPSPKRWWPNGLGEAYLYHFDFTLFAENTLQDSTTQKVGLRTVELVNEEDDYGECFYFKVNGHPLFIKGANYIPGDSFLHRVDETKLQQTFADAIDANMNMLRVWGGGVYQDDAFYELADESGILVWQDFMFACSLYPGDKQFIERVKAEAKYNIKRLRNHPCLAMWCGNNEVEMGISDWGWPEKFDYSEALQEKLQQEYHLLFRQVLPDLVAILDPERFYLPSSPIGFWEHPEQDCKGNHHYWGVWHGEEPFSEYRRRIPRFMSEYGFQSFPLIESVEKYVEPADWQLESDVMKVHQKHPRGNGLIEKYMLEDYRKPKDFASLLYLSQVQQGWGLKQAFEAHRFNRPYCMGTIYWQFNDCWPAASWSGIDYYGRWKALHYQAKRSFEPTIVVFEAAGNNIDLYIVNDLLSSKKLHIELQVMQFSGEVCFQKRIDFESSANSSAKAVSLAKEELLANCDETSCVLRGKVIDEQGQFISSNQYFFAQTKSLALVKPNVQIELQAANEGTFELKLSADTLVKDLHIGVQDTVINLSDNFVDLFPNEVKVITMPAHSGLAEKPTEEVKQLITLRSVFDTYN